MTKRNIKITVEYDGTRFKGWQTQKGTSDLTIQSALKKAVKTITGETVTIIGSGRTDRGVHARGQVAHFNLAAPTLLRRLLKGLNAVLPEDIAITKIEEVTEDFHAQYSVKTKTYRYRILNRAARSALDRTQCFHCPVKLDVRLMKEEARCLIGKKDFRSFQAADPARVKASTVRTISKLQIKKNREGMIIIDIEGDGFLYKMVRNVVGTLIEIGRGKLPPGSMKKILARKSRPEAGPTASPCGLILWDVQY